MDEDHEIIDYPTEVITDFRNGEASTSKTSECLAESGKALDNYDTPLPPKSEGAIYANQFLGTFGQGSKRKRLHQRD